MDKYNEALKEYTTELNDETVKLNVEKILHDNLEKNSRSEIYQLLFSCIDLTTLKTTDSNISVAAFTKRVNDFENEHPDMKNVAAICVYPNFASTVRMNLEVSEVNIAAVSAGFPSSQTFTEVKVAEFLAGEYQEMCDEIEEIKSACRNAHLKVILETGALKTASNIKKASILSMYSGADFIKTSTGKLEPAATLDAAYVMCQAIKEYHDKTGRMVGFKPAGGIVTTEDAVKYYCIVSEILGPEWLNKQFFRIGASRLANNLLSSIAGKEMKFF